MEKARRIRAERENAQADHPYAPQMTRRASATSRKLENEDSLGMCSRVFPIVSPLLPSLDILANKGGLRFDVGETFAPSPRHPVRGESSKAPSPGSDALGRELKRFPSNRGFDQVDVALKKDQHFASANSIPPADEVFMASLRSDKVVKGRPGWNDDLSGPEDPVRRRSFGSSVKESTIKPSPRLGHPTDERSTEPGQLKSR